MTFQNKSGLPDRDILLILRFIDPEELLYECDVIISNQRDRERSGLFIPFGGKNHGIIFKDGYETEEHLVNTLAHMSSGICISFSIISMVLKTDFLIKMYVKKRLKPMLKRCRYYGNHGMRAIWIGVH
jgi:hypothetical protein